MSATPSMFPTLKFHAILWNCQPTSLYVSLKASQGVTKLGFISLDSLKNRGTKLKSSRRRSHLLFTACLPSGQGKEE